MPNEDGFRRFLSMCSQIVELLSLICSEFWLLKFDKDVVVVLMSWFLSFSAFCVDVVVELFVGVFVTLITFMFIVVLLFVDSIVVDVLVF